ncbi:MAG: hypothetical protein JW769_03765 [Parachlamydiales bacterium]|nr:hypothetical protein [Parachlamydiales bacterium]
MSIGFNKIEGRMPSSPFVVGKIGSERKTLELNVFRQHLLLDLIWEIQGKEQRTELLVKFRRCLNPAARKELFQAIVLRLKEGTRQLWTQQWDLGIRAIRTWQEGERTHYAKHLIRTRIKQEENCSCINVCLGDIQKIGEFLGVRKRPGSPLVPNKTSVRRYEVCQRGTRTLMSIRVSKASIASIPASDEEDL